MFELVEPIGVIPYSAGEPNGRSSRGVHRLLGRLLRRAGGAVGAVPAEVVDALVYNFAPGEVARHVPKVWTHHHAGSGARRSQAGCVTALRRILGDHADSRFARAAPADQGGGQRPGRGRPMYAAMRAIPVPGEVVARFFHAASLLREHRGDGHIAALMTGVSAAWRRMSCSPSAWTCRRRSSAASTTSRPRCSPPDRRDARSRPDRAGRLAERTGPRRQTAGRGAHRRPRSQALPEPRPGRARRAHRHPQPLATLLLAAQD